MFVFVATRFNKISLRSPWRFGGQLVIDMYLVSVIVLCEADFCRGHLFRPTLT